MQKIIFLGTDLHGKASEHANKLVSSLAKETGGKILSIENRKKYSERKDEIVLPKFFNKDLFRKIIQSILLPVYILVLRFRYKVILTFWTPQKMYHYFLFILAKIIGYKLIFTIVSGKDKDYSCLKFCDKVICQSKNMQNYIASSYKLNSEVIYPWTDLEIFKPGKKKSSILIPSVPYKIEDFEERGMFEIIDFLRKTEFKAVVIFRSKEAYEYFSKLKLKNVRLINRIIGDVELGKIMGQASAIPLLYKKGSPDMPLSAIEGMAAGCGIICSEELGIAEIIKKEGGGFIVNAKSIRNTKNMMNEKVNRRARKIAEKYFDKRKNVLKYKSIIDQFH